MIRGQILLTKDWSISEEANEMTPARLSSAIPVKSVLSGKCKEEHHNDYFELGFSSKSSPNPENNFVWF